MNSVAEMSRTVKFEYAEESRTVRAYLASNNLPIQLIGEFGTGEISQAIGLGKKELLMLLNKNTLLPDNAKIEDKDIKPELVNRLCTAMKLWYTPAYWN